LLQTRDQEARRIARELHDSAGQLLAAISMNIAKVKAQAHKLDEVGARAVTENMGMIEQISSEIRTISHLLHPPLLDELGLASALRWYVEGFSERSKITVEVEIPSDLGRLPTEQEIAIFRIVQECLTNIHRHADSKTAAIRIRRDAEQIVVVAEDSGRGIPEEKRQSSSGGVGFRGMHERIRYLGGKLELHSDSNGTVVTATLPLEQAGAAGAGTWAEKAENRN
jgi:signal transduction histidine kinase